MAWPDCLGGGVVGFKLARRDLVRFLFDTFGLLSQHALGDATIHNEPLGFLAEHARAESDPCFRKL
jgi:hypothetical protein